MFQKLCYKRIEIVFGLSSHSFQRARYYNIARVTTTTTGGTSNGTTTTWRGRTSHNALPNTYGSDTSRRMLLSRDEHECTEANGFIATSPPPLFPRKLQQDTLESEMDSRNTPSSQGLHQL